jgi:hypothetical protein
MNLHARLRALELATARIQVGKRCSGCGYPNPDGTTYVIVESGIEPRCPTCRAWVDSRGRAAGRATATGETRVIVLVEVGVEHVPEVMS